MACFVAAALALAVAGCAGAKIGPSFEYRAPTLDFSPIYYPCTDPELNLRSGNAEGCVKLWRHDFEIIIDDLELLCEILGNPEDDCRFERGGDSPE